MYPDFEDRYGLFFKLTIPNLFNVKRRNIQKKIGIGMETYCVNEKNDCHFSVA